MSGKLSERFEGRPDAEAIFEAFVRNANGEAATGSVDPDLAFEEVGDTDVSTIAEPAVEDPTSGGPAPSGHVVLLTRRKKVAVDLDADDTQETLTLTEEAARQVVATFGGHRSAPARPPSPPNGGGASTPEEAEAAQVVPDVARVSPPAPPVPEKSEDGQIPAGELDRILTDLMVLVRYGHRAQVRERLDELVARYPEDLLLLRRIAEFHLENDDREGAIDSLFLLAGRLFERRNVVGMRQALEQVLVLDPKHKRAYKLLGLLEQRPDTGTGG